MTRKLAKTKYGIQYNLIEHLSSTVKYYHLQKYCKEIEIKTLDRALFIN